MSSNQNNIDIEIEYFDLQNEILFHPAKFVVMAIGRRWGKTEGLARWITEELLVHEKMPGFWFDTRQSNIDKYVHRYFMRIFGSARNKFRYDQQKKVLYFPNGSYIDFASAERPELAEGFGYKRVIINEAGIVFRRNGEQLWANTLRPMIDQNALVRIAGTPKGKNQFQKLYLMEQKNKSFKSFHLPSFSSPYFTKQQAEDIKSEISEIAYRQEILAEFVDRDGVVFKGIDKCIVGRPLLEKGEGDKMYIMGVDLGRTVDYTVIIVGDPLTKEIVYMERFRDTRWKYIQNRIETVSRLFNNAHVVIDATGMGSKIPQDLRAVGVSLTEVVYTNTIKVELIDNLALAIENREMTIPNVLNELIDELQIYEYAMTPSKQISYSAPDGYHDDCVNALALLNSAWSNKRKLLIDFL